MCIRDRCRGEKIAGSKWTEDRKKSHNEKMKEKRTRNKELKLACGPHVADTNRKKDDSTARNISYTKGNAHSFNINYTSKYIQSLKLKCQRHLHMILEFKSSFAARPVHGDENLYCNKRTTMPKETND